MIPCFELFGGLLGSNGIGGTVHQKIERNRFSVNSIHNKGCRALGVLQEYIVRQLYLHKERRFDDLLAKEYDGNVLHMGRL